MSESSPSASHRFVYVTVSSADEGESIARAVVGERLAACANLLPPMRSFYWWNDAVQADAEHVLVLKSRQDRLDALTARITALHSYEVPCVVALPILAGNPDYLAWLDRELDA